MPKASPMVRSFNAGEFSDLLQGRVDLDRYSASMRRMVNFIAAPQGPAISRSGTAFVSPVADETKYSRLVPFIFSNQQAKVLEFSRDRIRFLDEDGVQIQTHDIQVTSAANAPMVFTSVGLTTRSPEVGDQVILSNFPASYNLNGEVGNITSISGDTYSIDVVHPDKPVVNGRANLVYKVSCNYTDAELRSLRWVQSVDVIYLLCETQAPRKLSRFGDYDWRLEDVVLEDGPYMDINTTSTTLTPTTTGNAIPNMTSNILPSGQASGSSNRAAISGTKATPEEFLGRDITYNLDASEYWYAFDDDDETYWAANTAQNAIIRYTPQTPFVLDGYVIYVAKDNQDSTFSIKDYAPGTFVMEGFDGTDWHLLDKQEDYILYDGNKSVFIPVDNQTAYLSYRMRVGSLTRNGLIEPRIRRLVMRSASLGGITITASSTAGINRGAGFKSTDVGRHLRLKGSDNTWRFTKITAVTNSTTITVSLESEPFLDLTPIKDWRLGYWSDTTGWPATGTFFEDRLWLAGSTEAPDLIAASVTGFYERFSQTDPTGEVLDDNAIVRRLNSRKLSAIRWISSDTRGLTLGTGSEEYNITAPNNEALTARNLKARPSTRRGSAAVEPIDVDSQTLYVQRSGRALREFAYLFEADGYKSPSMSQLASHLGAVPFEEIVYAAEPHSIVWVRRRDGVLLGLTYNRDENVVGWHRHNLGAVIECMAVIPQKDELQDALWVVARRSINGTTRRYVERLTRFWDFDTELADAHFVDSGLRYSGGSTEVLYGLQHLEGQEVYGLANEKPVGPLTVTDGSITLPFATTSAVVGLGYESLGVIPRLENGAADGTAQGKVKRINSIVLTVWLSFNGSVGVWNKQENGFVYEPIEYPGDYSEAEEVRLYSGFLGPIQPSLGYDMDGIIAFKRPKESTLPFNISSIMPQLHTQDR